MRSFAKLLKCVLVTTLHLGRLSLNFANVQRVTLYDLPKDMGIFLSLIGLVGHTNRIGSAHILMDTHLDVAMAEPMRQFLNNTDSVIPDWLEALSNSDAGPVNEENGHDNIESAIEVAT